MEITMRRRSKVGISEGIEVRYKVRLERDEKQKKNILKASHDRYEAWSTCAVLKENNALIVVLVERIGRCVKQCEYRLYFAICRDFFTRPRIHA